MASKNSVFQAVVAGSLLLCSTISVYAQTAAGTANVPNVKLNRAADAQEDLTIRHKLAAIIIPNIEFHSTTISDAVEYLRQESRRLDTDPDQERRGVNIFLKFPAATQSAAAPILPSTDARITLTLSHIPLLEALKYIATQAGLKVRVESYAVSLVPQGEDTDPLINAVFRVSPDFIGNVTSGGNGKNPLDQAATTAQ